MLQLAAYSGYVHNIREYAQRVGLEVDIPNAQAARMRRAPDGLLDVEFSQYWLVFNDVALNGDIQEFVRLISTLDDKRFYALYDYILRGRVSRAVRREALQRSASAGVQLIVMRSDLSRDMDAVMRAPAFRTFDYVLRPLFSTVHGESTSPASAMLDSRTFYNRWNKAMPQDFTGNYGAWMAEQLRSIESAWAAGGVNLGEAARE